MSASANVLSIQTLENLKNGLARFKEESLETLNATAQEINRTLDWLAERQRHWQGEVRRRQEIYAKEVVALNRCQTPVRDSEGRVYIPPCTREQETARQAQVYLREAEAELRTVQDWTRLVQQAASDYQRQAQRLTAMLNDDLPKVNALLGRKIATLQSYIAMSAPSGGTAPPPPTGAASAPDRNMGDVIVEGIEAAALAVLGVGLVGVGSLGEGSDLNPEDPLQGNFTPYGGHVETTGEVKSEINPESPKHSIDGPVRPPELSDGNSGGSERLG